MKLGFIGLGRMGHNMVLNLLEKKHQVVAYNRTTSKIKPIVRKGAIGAYSLEEVVEKLPKGKRIIVLMVSAGPAVDTVMKTILPLMNKGDTIIEAGNSWFEDSRRRYLLCKKRGINFLDMGTSGGLDGARHGASLMIGGDNAVFKKHEKLFKDIATKDGYGYMGPAGAGHFVKMVHNGIEYALEQSYAEGYEVLKKSPYKLDFEQISKVWSHGSIIRSFLTEISVDYFKKDPQLKGFSGKIGGGQTGGWTLKQAKKEKVDFGSLEYALKKRVESQKKQTFASKVVSAMRFEFGGHEEPK